MLSDQFSILLRTFMILGGLAGFLIGAGLAYWRDFPMATAIFRVAVLCLIGAFLAKIVAMSLFRAHVKAIQMRKNQPPPPGSHS